MDTHIQRVQLIKDVTASQRALAAADAEDSGNPKCEAIRVVDNDVTRVLFLGDPIRVVVQGEDYDEVVRTRARVCVCVRACVCGALDSPMRTVHKQGHQRLSFKATFPKCGSKLSFETKFRH